MTRISLYCTTALAVASWIGPARAEVSTIVARQVDAANEVFEQPDAAAGPWTGVEPHSIILLPQNITPPSRYEVGVENVEVRVVHNGTWIGIAARWADATEDVRLTTGAFCDAVAVGFPMGGLTETSPFMGTPAAGMEINHWKAIWQRDVDAGYQDVTDLHPNIVADEYVGFRSDDLPDSNPASTVPMADMMATPEARQGLPAVAIGNPMSQVARTHPVEQSMAEGFGTLTTQKQQDARAHGVYADGHWTVVITRPLDTGDDADLILSAGMETGLNVAVWDGAQSDVGGRKSYSMFTPLRIAAAE